MSGSTFDCTNTAGNVQGNTCETGLFGSFFVVSTMPSAAPLETPSASPVEEMSTPSAAPLETPSTSPVEMPVPATSFGSSHTSKVAIVVSAAAAAWLASFGT
jgi:hypothetical protein